MALFKFDLTATNVENWLYKFFIVLTICPIRLNQNLSDGKINYQNTVRVKAFFVIIIIVLYSIGIIFLRIWFINPKSEFSILTEAVNTFIITMNSIIILIETQYTYKNFAIYLQLKYETENDLKMLCSEKQFEKKKYSFITNYCKILIGYQLFAWTMQIINIVNVARDPVWKFYSCCFLVPSTVSRLRCLQHQLYTSTLHFYTKMIRKRMEKICDYLNTAAKFGKQQYRDQFTQSNQKMFNDLKLSMRIYNSIFRMSKIINEMFTFSLLMTILEHFIRLLTSSFWIYSKFYYGDLDNLLGNFRNDLILNL